MAAITIPGLVAKTNKAGITSWYWQPSGTLRKAGWEPLTLGKDRASAMMAAEARNKAVAEWKLGGTKPAEVSRRAAIGTVAQLIDRYTADYVDGVDDLTGRRIVKPSTAAGYRTNLARIDAWAGKQPLAFVTPARVGVLRKAIARPREAGGLGHAAALATLKTLRQLFAFAESVDLIPKGSNPATSFGLGGVPARRAVWEAEDEAAFIASAFELGLPELALACELALYTAQREADLLAMTDAQFAPLTLFDARIRDLFADKDGTVWGWSFAQAKSNETTLMQIPFEPAIATKVARILATNRAKDRAATPKRLITHVLVDQRTGLPWKQRAFITAWTRVLDHAATATNRPHMRQLVWHDLRRTRVVRLRRMGMDPAMIASITGHKPASINMMLKVYGPIDPNMTAAALASTLPAKEQASG